MGLVLINFVGISWGTAATAVDSVIAYSTTIHRASTSTGRGKSLHQLTVKRQRQTFVGCASLQRVHNDTLWVLVGRLQDNT